MANGWKVSRYRYFSTFSRSLCQMGANISIGLACIASFVWFWFPDYLCTCLSSFAFMTWIWPNNQKINTIFGVSPGPCWLDFWLKG